MMLRFYIPPCATGDSWVVKDKNEVTHYVQFFEHMDKHQEQEMPF